MEIRRDAGMAGEEVEVGGRETSVAKTARQRPSLYLKGEADGRQGAKGKGRKSESSDLRGPGAAEGKGQKPEANVWSPMQ
jgi:hypothetical protein